MATAADAGYEPVFPSSNETQGFDVNNYPWDYIDWTSAALASQPWDSPQLGLQSFSPATIEGDAVWHNSSTFTSQKKTTNSSALHMLRSLGFTMPSISYREHTDAGAQRVSLLMLQTLKSYPQMMMRQKTLPPFIHPSLLLGDTNDDLEAWHNCMSLVHMANSKIHGSRKLFWRNVRAECERFCEQHLQLNKWELLAAMQALAAYVIFRLDEAIKDYSDIDTVLLKAVTLISIQLMAVDTTADASSSLDSLWKTWIVEESRRRLCAVFQIIGMLVYFEPAKLCEANGDVVLAPLPAQKQLWEATDEHTWKLQGETEHDMQIDFGLTKNGDLVELQDTAKWNEWCSGMDGIGYKTHHGIEDILGNPWVGIERAVEGTWPDIPDGKSRSRFTRQDWDALWGNEYDIVTDLACPFTDQLITAYPQAKIVIVQRDFDSWWKSYQAAVLDNIFPRRQWLAVWLIRNVLRSRAADAMIKINYGLFGARNLADIKANARKTYDEYYRNIREKIPAERRLEYTMGDGWEPLCSFLGKEVPDVPFPRLNDSAYRNKSQRDGEYMVFLTSAKKLAWLAVAVATIGTALWHLRT
ncbi:hypothetical protein LEL_08898 [Akanthomyces lecanii RCEF 1005]|uniref:Uncharacterized protein n=1 Tax=Akanthomyces lecanii RCEF 1005 TaxID=1081108 RepID=A0A168CQB6_CORDF|nr:hypothetical protein LEL_08898 [Akanthomyces lecanii RCEF 1005]